MALRSLDNALPMSPERPKKIAKVAAARSEIARVVKNDENAAPLPPPKAADASVEYVASCDLKPLTDPEIKITRLLEELDSKDWTKVCEALNDVRRIALHHSSLLQPMLHCFIMFSFFWPEGSQLHLHRHRVMLVMVKAMKNPRSALCKTSIMASTDIFRSFGHVLLPTTPEEDAFDHLLLQLLMKASQDKRFVCEEAEKSLHEMTCFLPSIPLLKKLQCYVKHANLKVRAKAAVYLSTCVAKMDNEVVKEFGLENLLHVAADLLNDRLPEARESARNVVNVVYQAFSRPTPPHHQLEDCCCPSPSPNNSWQEFCFANLRPTSAQSIAKIILQ